MPRRRPVSEIQRWLPTIIFCAALVALIVVVLATRAVIGAFAPSPAPEPAAVVDHAQVQVAVEVPAPAQPAPQLRFSSRPLDATYSVVPGDTLSAIAQRFNTTTAAVRGINNLPDDAILRVGQRLVIP